MTGEHSEAPVLSRPREPVNIPETGICLQCDHLVPNYPEVKQVLGLKRVQILRPATGPDGAVSPDTVLQMRGGPESETFHKQGRLTQIY